MKPSPIQPVHTLLDAALPGGDGQPLLRLQVEVETVPSGGGEETHLRVHLRSRFSEAALAAPVSRQDALAQDRKAGAGRLPARRVAALVRRGLSNQLTRRLARPLLGRDLNTWIDVRASTAPLLGGVRALMPRDVEKLQKIGVQLPAGDGPVARTWSGAISGSGARLGFAQFSLLRLDKRHLPAVLATLLGNKPFQMVATVAQVVEACAPE
ncbi:MAG TPA: hypothetical protein VFQ88_02000 [Nevskiaceae bacterium]|nr:hypothetical protein [Nevskiaceae bacterium]